MKKPLLLVALAICAACNLSTGTDAGPVVPRTVDSTGHPYSVYIIQGSFMPYTYVLGVTHTILSANLCLFTNGTSRFSETEETPSNLNPDAYYETYSTYTVSATTGKVTFAGQNPGTGSIGTDSLSYFSTRNNRLYFFAPNQSQLNQSCVNPAPTTH
jgi:hypothetical protein